MATREELQQEIYQREACRRYLMPFVERMNPSYTAGWVHKDICLRLEQFYRDVLAKKSPRLMLFCPPRLGKSLLASQNFPAWVLGNQPTFEIIQSSYGLDLAVKFSRKTRALVSDPEYRTIFKKTELDNGSKAAENWLLTSGGGYVAAGVGGGITGKGCHIGIIDDPVKDAQQADSETVREAVWEWYTSTFYTRLAPGGGILLIMTRWHFDDLAGRLLAEMDNGGDQWEVVAYPAIATHDEKYRRKGDALHPARFDKDAYTRIKNAVGSRVWSALYQQTPVAEEGSYFSRDDFRFYKELPRHCVFFTVWDLAISEKETADFSCGFVVAVCPSGHLYFVDRYYGQWSSAALMDTIIESAKSHPDMVLLGIERDKVLMALSHILNDRLRAEGLGRLKVEELEIRNRDKLLRARPIQMLMQSGRIHWPVGEDWVFETMNEALKFPLGRKDDQVDAMAWAGQIYHLVKNGYRPKAPVTKSWRDRISGLSKRHPSKKTTFMSS